MSEHILSRVQGHAGIISLNRTKALHALTIDMVHAMTRALLDWRDDLAVKLVIIDHAEGRGFCAGGDIAFLRGSALNDGGTSGRRFFHDEYQLNHLLFTYPKPVIVFMDGITMGGGVGISLPARYRVATENTRLAMPETGIGLFPDVGGGWYLSRLEGRVGQFLALTGARLDGAECVALGLATHYIPEVRSGEAKRKLSDGDPARIDRLLSTMAETPREARVLSNISAINRHFASERFEDILSSLEGDESSWAIKELAALRAKSPQTCKVALRQLCRSKAMADFTDNMAMEYRIASRVLTRPDFTEGVRAVIIDKDAAPRWDPATAEGVTEVLLDEIFAPLPADQEWKPL